MSKREVVLGIGYCWIVYHMDFNRDSVMLLSTKKEELEQPQQVLSLGEAPDMSEQRGTLIWRPDPPAKRKEKVKR